LLADFLFPEGEVAGAWVQDDVDSAAGEEAAGAVGDPGVFANFEADTNTPDFKNGISDGEKLAAEFVIDNDAFRPGVEPAGFVVESVAGEIFLGDKPSDLSVGDEGDGIIDGIFDPDRKANGDDEAFSFGNDLKEAVPGALGDFVGEKLVLAPIACDGEFREAKDRDFGVAGLLDRLQNAAAVPGPVHGNLIQAACAYSDGVSHGETLP